MTNSNLYAPIIGQVQFGPVYRCWICGTPVGVTPFHKLIPPPTALDCYAEHLAYLDLRFDCSQQHHPARVVVVGPAITPVDWPSSPFEARFAAIEAALEVLTAALQDRRAEGNDGFDPALAVALRLYARVLSPAQGAAEVRAFAEVAR